MHILKVCHIFYLINHKQFCFIYNLMKIVSDSVLALIKTLTSLSGEKNGISFGTYRLLMSSSSGSGIKVIHNPKHSYQEVV